MNYFAAVAAALFILVLGTTFALAFRPKKRSQEEEKKLQEAIQEGVSKGECDSDGKPICVVCGALSTHPLPSTGQMAFDKWPGVSLLNELTSMPWKYSQEYREENSNLVCARHNDAARRQLETFHAQLRAELAEFNAMQQNKVQLMNSGGLVRLLRDQERAITNQLGIDGGAQRVLRSATDSPVDSTYMLPGVKTGQ